MAETLKPSEVAEFTTALIFPEAGDVVAAAWAGAVAGNTGWLAYQGLPWPWFTITAGEGSTETRTHRVYLTAGSYTFYAGVALRGASITGQGTLLVDGTEISYVTGQAGDFTRDSEQVVIDTARWVDIAGTLRVVTVTAGDYGAFYGYYRPAVN